MSVLYCSHCGAKLEYGVEKPKFCSHCGASLGGSQAAAKEEVPPASEDAGVPFLEKLAYDVTFESGPVTLGSVIEAQLASSPEGPSERSLGVRPPVNEAERGQSADDIIKESVKQCKSSRQPRDVSE